MRRPFLLLGVLLAVARTAVFLLSSLITVALGAVLVLVPNDSLRLILLGALAALIWLNGHVPLISRALRGPRDTRSRQYSVRRAATARRRSPLNASRDVYVFNDPINANTSSTCARDGRWESCRQCLLVLAAGAESPVWRHPVMAWRRALAVLTR